MKEAPQKFEMDQIEHYFATFLIFKRKLSPCPSAFWKYFDQKKIHLHLCDYLDFEHCIYERRPQATIYLFVHIAQKVYAQ